MEWRIALHLYNGFVQEIVKSRVHSSQHAYLAGKGVMTAWRGVLNKINRYKWVYETDLQAFFPSVSVWKILEILKLYDALKIQKGS